MIPPVYLTQQIPTQTELIPTMSKIKSGIFIMPFHDPVKPVAQAYDEDMELVVRADELGFDEFWIGSTIRWRTRTCQCRSCS